MSRLLTEFDFVMSILVQKMRNAAAPKSRERPGIVFLLGAGCSRQYGLPGFRELLTDIWEDCFLDPPDPSWSLDVLRDKIDQYWHSESPDFLRERLNHYLKRVNGAHCTGYRRLARLARDGYIKAIVNMNFDVLLEEALDAEGVRDYVVSTTFGPKPAPKGLPLIVYKPHGSIGCVHFHRPEARLPHGDLILDIANSDIFANPEEQKAAHRLMTGSDIVVLGYAGGDAKIAEALRGFHGRDPRTRKLFMVNLLRPDPRLLPAIAERSSHYLTLSGEDAGFENFMERLEELIGETIRRLPSSAPRSTDEINPMTREERKALTRCLRYAVTLRLSMNVAERSTTSIEEHGNEIFRYCLKIARHAGVCLSSPEKYILNCAAFLHDLGYYRGHSRSHANENPGWSLLLHHGRKTRELLEERRKELKEIIPTTYDDPAAPSEFLETVICRLCEGHTGLIEVEKIPDSSLTIGGVEVPVRFSLLLALFALAEDITEGHPFLPSPDPIGPESEEGRGAIIDPVLDLYLRRKKEIVNFSPERGRIVARVRSKASSAVADWFLAMARVHVERFNKAAHAEGGWGMELVITGAKGGPPYESGTDDQDLTRLLTAALEEGLDGLLTSIVRKGQTLHELLRKSERSVGEVLSLLDLVLMYAYPYRTGDRRSEAEPRVSIEHSEAVGRALGLVAEEMKSEPKLTHQILIYRYLCLKRTGSRDALDRMFVRSFEEIIHPGWRFFARNWHDDIESLLMARACLELGSTRFRPEVAGGLRELIRSKLSFEDRLVNGQMRTVAFAHQECTVCTSRLLYALAHAKRLFPRHEEKRMTIEIDQAIGAILRFFLSRPAGDDSWWGVGPPSGADYAIRSADYLAWAARSIAFCFAVDREIHRKTGSNWLSKACGIQKGELENLLRERWQALWDADCKMLLSGDAEEPYSFILGRVALAQLELQNLAGEIGGALPRDEQTIDGFIRELREAARLVRGDGIAQMSQFYLWPATVLEHAYCEPHEEASIAREIVELCYRCVGSRVWIREGADSGSWGFNVKNTQAIVLSLAAFWCYVLEDEKRCDRFRDVFESFERTGRLGSVQLTVLQGGLPEAAA